MTFGVYLVYATQMIALECDDPVIGAMVLYFDIVGLCIEVLKVVLKFVIYVLNSCRMGRSRE